MEYGEKDQYASDDEDGEDYEYEDTYEYEDGEYSPVSHGIESVSTPPGPKAEEKGSVTIRSGHKSALGNISIVDGKYTITEISQVMPIMRNLVTEVSALLRLNEDICQLLLQQYKWNKEKLLEMYYSDGDSEKILVDTGVDLYDEKVLAQITMSDSRLFQPPSSSIPKEKLDQDCRICTAELDTSNSFALGCKHYFCRECYGEYIRVKVVDGPSCIKILKCPEYKCNQTITHAACRELVTSEIYEKYDVYVTRNFIETSKNMRYCPAAGCDKVAVGSGISCVQCTCGHPFCFRCGEESHAPCSCEQLAEWMTKCTNESETANWILANTKKCPNCNTRIEKNQGCNHMNCGQCKYEFCWICMGKWSDHGQVTGGYYKCNRYDSGKTTEGQTEAQKAKRELDRYLHYYQRYHGHDQSLNFASQKSAQTEQRMVEKQNQDKSSWIDVQYIKQATDQVVECRRVLKYTYVLGFFLTTDKDLFEHHQEMLEKNTDLLHELTEQSVEVSDRTQIINLTRVTSKFMESLLESMKNGIVESSVDKSK